MEDSDEDDFDDLDDEEVSLGSMDEDFGEDFEEEGGTFMDVSDDNDPGKTLLDHLTENLIFNSIVIYGHAL